MAEQQQEQQQSRSAGKVLWFNDQKGFGFIRPDDESEDLFVHQSSIKSDGYRSLAEGESVEFTVSQGNGGKTQAVDVTAIGGSPISKKDRRGGGGGGFGGGWRGGNDRRNGNGCFNCGDLNHLARDCSKNASNYNDSDNYSNVPNGGGGGSYCYNCGEAGHFARECRRDSGGVGGGGSGKCYNCGKYGHFARDCNRNSGGGGGSSGSCFVCGGFGHLARDCDNNRELKCFNCGEAGHYARECANFSGKKDYTVWPGVLSGAGTPPISPTGFILQPGESTSISIPTSWSGRLWGRTFCTEDSSGKFSCLTGDCGSSALECSGGGGIPPATLAEFTLNGAGGLDFYDVSLVDGYNLPMMVSPQGGTGGNCTSAGCAAYLNGDCPLELKVVDGTEGVACKSACDALGDPKYCCSGAYATPNTCKPSSYSEFFKTACPTAYSYAYDDGTSTFTCAGADYVITFCPTPSTSVKSANPMAVDISVGYRPVSSALIGGAITTLAAIWQLRHLF